MLAWSARFLLLGAGNPAGGAWMFVLSMIVYGVAFDFFNISGSLYVNSCVDEKRRSGAQGLFMLATNGLGASIGMIAAQMVVNYSLSAGGWAAAWYIFAAYAAVVALLFLLCFKEK
ncbi:MAG: MFS transporter, partial [Bacteroidaceae bacterium]|nr:MFS transporter [Bacteroidaceae bacterium]